MTLLQKLAISLDNGGELFIKVGDRVINKKTNAEFTILKISADLNYSTSINNYIRLKTPTSSEVKMSYREFTSTFIL